MSENPSAHHVTVEVAGKLAGISSRTLRHWIASGKLSAIAGKRGKVVSLREVEYLARIVGKPIGNMSSAGGNPATSAGEVAGKLAESLAGAALVTDTARQQLATIRDEWLAPLIAQLGDQAERIGRLAAEGEAKDHTIVELRRRVEQAEAELARRHEEEARAAELLRRRNEQEWLNGERMQAAEDGPGAAEAPTAAQGDAPGVWGRLTRWWEKR